MTNIVKKIALSEQAEAREDKRVTDNCLELISSVEVECLVRLGTLTLSIAQLRDLKHGQTLVLEQKTHEPVDLVINNQVIARGELMCCDDNFAIKITEVCS